MREMTQASSAYLDQRSVAARRGWLFVLLRLLTSAPGWAPS
jgi:hypothetical protein